MAPAAFADAEIDALVRQIAGRWVQAQSLRSDHQCRRALIYAVLSPDGRPDRHFDAATGAGCHPVAAIAARRAIVEAAQTRISIIAGSRDDIAEADYGARLSRDIAVLTETGALTRPAPVGLARRHEPGGAYWSS